MTASKTPRMFVSVPWKELTDLYFRIHGGSRERVGVTSSILIDNWAKHIGQPRGFTVKRWRYDSDTDRVIMDLNWRRKPKIIGGLDAKIP